MVQTSNTAGRLLSDLRRGAGLSLRELARRAQTSAATLSDYERGVKEPKLSTLERIADAIGGEIRSTVVIRMKGTLGIREATQEELARAIAIRDALELAESIRRGKALG